MFDWALGCYCPSCNCHWIKCDGACGQFTKHFDPQTQLRQIRYHNKIHTKHKQLQSQPNMQYQTNPVERQPDISTPAPASNIPIAGTTEYLPCIHNDDTDIFSMNSDSSSCTNKNTTTVPSVMTMSTECTEMSFYNILKQCNFNFNSAVRFMVLPTLADTTSIHNLQMPSETNVQALLLIYNLSKSMSNKDRKDFGELLSIFYPSFIKDHNTNWWPLPYTVEGLQSLRNPSNKHSLRAMIPKPTIIDITSKLSYIPMNALLSYLMITDHLANTKWTPYKWKLIVESREFQQGLLQAKTSLQNVPPDVPLLFVAFLIWSDGWDPKSNVKRNRYSMWTLSSTFIFYDMHACKVIGTQTFPTSNGEGKVDHSEVFHCIYSDMQTMQTKSASTVYHCTRYQQPVCLYPFYLLSIQDHPERRDECLLRRGNALKHRVFGFSCCFEKLRKRFDTCNKCFRGLLLYIKKQDWTKPFQRHCMQCHYWSLDDIHEKGEYIEPMINHPNIARNTPFETIITKPQRLTFEAMIEMWEYTINNMNLTSQITDGDWSALMELATWNDKTIKNLKLKCGNYYTWKSIQEHPEKYTIKEQNDIKKLAKEFPHLYKLPQVPSVWKLGRIDQHIEALMHTSKGIQKATFQLIHAWAVQFNKGKNMIDMTNFYLQQLQTMNVTISRVYTYKDMKYGGWICETFSAYTMIAPWIFQNLTDTFGNQKGNNLSNETYQALLQKPVKQWYKQECLDFLTHNGINFSPKINAKEARAKVEEILKQKNTEANNKASQHSIVTNNMIRELVWVMFKLFNVLYSYDVIGDQGKHRAQAISSHFLTLFHRIDQAINPMNKTPQVLSKYNFISLMRLCETYHHHLSPRCYYEGPLLGEGIVKPLRAMCLKTIQDGWGKHLLDAYSENASQKMLHQALNTSQTSSDNQSKARFKGLDKFRLYKSWTEVSSCIHHIVPLSIVVYGYTNDWIAGFVLKMESNWYLRTINVLRNKTSVKQDKYGFVYHQFSVGEERTIHKKKQSNYQGGKLPKVVCGLPFYGYALMLPEPKYSRQQTRKRTFQQMNIDDNLHFGRYAMIQENWLVLDKQGCWTVPWW